MAILGGDIHDPNNPLTLDTLEDLKTTLLGITVGGKYYIAFPEVYNGPKVIDLRARGWNPISFSLNYSIDGNVGHLYIYIYFNGWTILGLSMSDQTFFSFKSESMQNNGCSYMYIYDLIMKNCYFLTITSNICAFRHSRGNNYGDGRLTFKNCKFSAVLDNQASTDRYTEFIVGGSSTGNITIDTCSFNINFTNSNADARIEVIESENSNMNILLINSIVSLNSKRIMTNSPDDNRLIRRTNMRFCKVIGNIKHYNSGNSYLICIISASSQSVYNVVDLVFRTTRDYGNGVTMRISFGSGVNIVNTDNIKTADNQTPTIEGDYKTLCTTAQMVDKDWLNDHFFICGDTPSD